MGSLTDWLKDRVVGNGVDVDGEKDYTRRRILLEISRYMKVTKLHEETTKIRQKAKRLKELAEEAT